MPDNVSSALNNFDWGGTRMAANIVNGMNLDKLETFRSALKESPVILGLGARCVWEGHSGRSTVHIGPYELGGKRIERENSPPQQGKGGNAAAAMTPACPKPTKNQWGLYT